MKQEECGRAARKAPKVSASKIRLVALDLDDTLLRWDGTLSSGNRDALVRAVELGIHVVPASGRVLSALPEELLSIPGLEYAVTANGARVMELATGRTIYQNCIGWSALKPLLPVLLNEDRVIEVFTGGKVYAEPFYLESPEKFGVSKNRVEYVRSTRIPVEDMEKFLQSCPDEIENINLIYRNQEEKTADLAFLKNVPGLAITSSMVYNLEIGGETVSKADGLAHLCGQLGVGSEEVMACGDSGNDLEMLRFAGVSVAMGNASEEVKKAARYVTSSNEEDGVAVALECFALFK